MDDKYYEEMSRQIEELQRQNQMLKLEHELRSYRQELGEMSGLLSTPAPGKDEQGLGSRKVWSDIPKGRPDDAHGAEAGLSEAEGIDSHEIPDRFVTNRKKPASSGSKSKDVIMKPATYDGSVAWMDYKAHFDACAELNGWTDQQKGLYLSVSLRGQAQGVFGNLESGKHDYGDLVRALEERFAPPNQTELYRVQLRERRQKASESMAELGQDIRRLTNLAYHKAPSDVRETLAKEQFVDSLINTEMRLKIKQARPVDLNDAVRHAVELEAFYRAESRQAGQGFINTAVSSEQVDYKKLAEAFTSLNNRLDEMTEVMNKLFQQRNSNYRQENQPSKQGPVSNSRPPAQTRTDSNTNRQRVNNGSYKPEVKGQNRTARRCFNCNSDQHLIKDCTQPKTSKRDKDKPGSTNKESVCLSSTNHAGLFVQAKLGEYGADCLVDSGATLSLLSSKVWSTIKGTVSLEKFDQEIVSASGNVLDTKGKANVCFVINGVKCVMDVVIAEMDIDAILGLDFMSMHDVIVDVVGMTMHIKGTVCPLVKIGKIGCYQVIVKERVHVPSRSEVILEGQMVDWDPSDDNIGIIETSDKFLNSNRGVVARTLVKANGKIPIRYANFSNEDQILYPGTNIAEFCPAQVLRAVQEVKTKPPRNLPKHLTELYERASEGMSSTQKKQIANLLGKYGDIFSKDEHDLGRTGIIKHKISVDNTRPIKQAMRRVPVHMQDEVDRQLDLMLEHDIIQPSTSPWASAIVLVKKKDGSRRFCIDYRRLNDVTVKDAYPLPRIDESLDQLAGAKWFSCLDLSAGYWQVEVDPDDRQKTAFITRRGLYEFNVMPFGLCNAPATFERLMELVLSGLHWQICLIYLDDIIIFGKTFAEMIQNLDTVLERFAQAGLKLKSQKCQLFKREVDFLGHVINEHGIHTNPQKIECVKTWPTPKNITELRSFLGLCSYYRRFIINYSHVAKPLTRLTEKDQRFNWTTECSEAFGKLKHMLVTAPILAHPDFTKPFILDTDASNHAIGAVLSQKTGNEERVIAYASRTLSKSERKYCVTRKELLALVYFVKYFRHYLYGRKFTARTDHASLRWLMNFKNPEGQVARWLEVLSTFSMAIEHRPGRLHGNADGMSRKPCIDDTVRTSNSEIPQDNSKDLDPSCMHVGSENTDESISEFDDLESLQADDDELAVVRSWVQANKRPEFAVIAAEGYILKSLWNQFPCLELHDNLLVRRQENLDEDNVVTFQVIVPKKARRSILYVCHDMKTSGHLGVTKTVSKIKQKFYWPGLQSDVRSYIAGCDACSKRKGPIPSKRAPMQIVRSGFPMERIAIDILGELPETPRGNKYIVVIGDYFTKWTEALPIPNMEACTVAKVLVENVLCRFGIPQVIHSDQGRQFESNLFQEMCKLLGIHKTRTTPYHPQSDGMVERFNRTLAAMLSAYVSENHRDWDEQLPYVTMAYRSTEHETTGMSPNMLMFGREVSTPLDLVYELPNLSKPIPNNQWVWELRDRIERSHALVRQYTQQAMHRQKRNRDSRTSFETFKIGDQVFVHFPVKKVGTSAKLTPFWRGPFKVTGKLSEVLYKVNCGRNNAEQIIHCDRIKLCRQQVLRGELEQSDIEGHEEGHAHEPENNDEPEADRDNEIDEIEELESDHQPIMDTDRDYESDRKRVRRKPVWAKDYVFSCRMVNTKVTPRKHNNMADKAKTRCTWCKELFEEGDQYEQHMIKCYRNRWTCHACGNTFKLKSYLEKHKRTQHQAWASINRTLKRSAGHFKVGLKTNSHVAKANVDEEKHHLDDQSKVKGSEEKHVSDCQVKKDKVTLKRKKEIKVTCESMIKEGSSEAVTTVTENGEETYRDKVRRKKQKTGPVKIDIGDIVPDGSIRASDISLQLKGEGNVELILTYCPESDD